MIELDQMKLELQQYETPLEEVRDSLDLDYKRGSRKRPTSGTMRIQPTKR